MHRLYPDVLLPSPFRENAEKPNEPQSHRAHRGKNTEKTITNWTDLNAFIGFLCASVSLWFGFLSFSALSSGRGGVLKLLSSSRIASRELFPPDCFFEPFHFSSSHSISITFGEIHRQQLSGSCHQQLGREFVADAKGLVARAAVRVDDAPSAVGR